MSDEQQQDEQQRQDSAAAQEPIPLRRSRRRRRTSPHVPAVLHQHYQALAEASAGLQEKVMDLEQDWHLRPPEFWRAILTLLVGLRQSLQPCIDTINESIGSLPLACSSAVVPLCKATDKVERVGLQITMYLPTCGWLKGLPERQQILEELRELNRALQRSLHLISGKEAQA